MSDKPETKWTPPERETWWINSRGYVEGRVWRNSKRSQMKQHRHVMQEHLKRYLSPDEHVHHINGDKQDNCIENLQLVSQSEHSRITNSQRIYVRGYKLDLTDAERKRRSQHMKRLHETGIAMPPQNRGEQS